MYNLLYNWNPAPGSVAQPHTLIPSVATSENVVTSCGVGETFDSTSGSIKVSGQLCAEKAEGGKTWFAASGFLKWGAQTLPLNIDAQNKDFTSPELSLPNGEHKLEMVFRSHEGVEVVRELSLRVGQDGRAPASN